ncbi:sensory transduction histidine kinase [hydrothermal vent metagenome]|uniref:histidine kinase n=1 Tax=hydrothermal vent metagenome TaxID=652676 RepID=A0A1W1CB93_9ZZZZ
MNIDINSNKSILKESYVYITAKNSSIKEIVEKNLFKLYSNSYINIGASKEYVWIKLKFFNSSNKTASRVLLFTSSLLEQIELFDAENFKVIEEIDLVHKRVAYKTLLPYLNIKVEPNSTKTYYIKVHSFYTPVGFGIKLQKKDEFLYKDKKEQLISVLLIGIVLAFMLYSLFIFFYTKDKSYIFYSLYLLALIYQQITYLGFTQIYFPFSFVSLDISIPIFKVALLIITSSLFAIHFLKIERIPLLYKIYKFFIIITLIEVAIFSIPKFHNIDIIVVTGAFFIIFNLLAGIIAYLKGYKQARLFVVGFGIVFISYFVMISNALGFSSILQDFRNMLIYSTAFEALVLTLAFVDRYLILKAQKDKTDTKLFKEIKNRASIVEEQVILKTQKLNRAVETQKLLIKEIHHRVKNNLQIIVSLLRMQKDETKNQETQDRLEKLEYRIKAIEKTYNLLIVKDNIENVDMQEYIESLLLDISQSYNFDRYSIDTKVDADITMPLKQAVYIGLIINELATNSYKYAFADKNGEIRVTFTKDSDNYTLIVQDNGKGFNTQKESLSLGSKLIETLALKQLDGSLNVYTDNGVKYIIRFKI